MGVYASYETYETVTKLGHKVLLSKMYHLTEQLEGPLWLANWVELISQPGSGMSIASINSITYA